MKKIVLTMVEAYQKTLSLLLGGKCRFYPSCSEYFKRAIRGNSFFKALFMGLKRIVKCHPWHPGGIDIP